MKVVIVGGVAGGASAAARIRRLDEHAQIVMIERSGYVSYANCGLPYGFTCAHLAGGYSFYQAVMKERLAQSPYPCGMERI